MRFAIYIKHPGRDVLVAASDDNTLAHGRALHESMTKGSTVYMADHHAIPEHRYSYFNGGRLMQDRLDHETLHQILNY